MDVSYVARQGIECVTAGEGTVSQGPGNTSDNRGFYQFMSNEIRTPGPETAQALRAFLETSDFTEHGLFRVLGVVVEPALPYLRNRPRLLDLTREPTALNLLLRLFLISEPCPVETASRLFPTAAIDAMLESGLIEEKDGEFTGQHLLLPCGDFVIASDHQGSLADGEDDNHVIHVNPASRFVCNAMMPRQVETALDLGTGCGIIALQAALRARRVIGTDLNPRAIEFGRFNARLNGIENIGWRVGDGFAPVADESFDLIACNPPFILAPGSDFVYRDNNMELDRFCHKLVQEAPGLLADGGVFQMIFEWVERGDADWEAAIRGWFDGLPCDAWLIREYRESPENYAEMRLKETVYRSEEDDQREYDEWLQYYREKGVTGIYGGLVTLRKRSGGTEGWRRIEVLPEATAGPFGADLEAGLAAADFLDSLDSDADLLRAKLRLNPAARLRQAYRQHDGDWEPVELTMFMPGGLKRRVAIDGSVAQFLAGLDGTQILDRALEAFATASGIDADELRVSCVPIVGSLIWQGFLVPG